VEGLLNFGTPQCYNIIFISFTETWITQSLQLLIYVLLNRWLRARYPLPTRPLYTKSRHVLVSRTVYRLPLFIQLAVHPTNSPSTSVWVNPMCSPCVSVSDDSTDTLKVCYLIKHRVTLLWTYCILNCIGCPRSKFGSPVSYVNLKIFNVLWIRPSPLIIFINSIFIY